MPHSTQTRVRWTGSLDLPPKIRFNNDTKNLPRLSGDRKAAAQRQALTWIKCRYVRRAEMVLGWVAEAPFGRDAGYRLPAGCRQLAATRSSYRLAPVSVVPPGRGRTNKLVVWSAFISIVRRYLNVEAS